MRNVLLILLLAVVAYAAPEDWSEPVMIADGEEYSHYDTPSFDLHTDISYTTISRYWDGSSKINYIKHDQYGNVLIGPKLILDTADSTRPKACVILDNNLTYVFYYKNAGVIYHMAIYNGDVIVKPSLFIDTNNVANQNIIVAKEDNNTMHIIYPMINTTFLVGYTRWNPDTGERLDIEGIVVDDPRVDDQIFNGYFDIDVDSEGNAHIFFDQTLRYEIGMYQLETIEVCWARVDDDSTGEYTSRILSTFYTDGCNDVSPSGTVDDDDNIHVVWKGKLGPEYEHCGIYYKMDNDGNGLIGYKSILADPDTSTGRMTIRYNNNILSVIAVEKNEQYVMAYLDLTGNVVEDFHPITDVMLDWDYNDRPDYIHHNNGFINIVWREGDDLWYMHNQVGLETAEAELQARPADDGLLLTWREDASSASATWALKRDGSELTRLSGEADYAYLDRDVEPGVSYSYTLTATKPDGEILTFGPVEATWQDDSRTKPTLDAPYPNPASDSLTLRYTLPPDTTSASITIFDLSGRRITEQALDPASGRHSLVLDVAEYPQGVYIARIAGDNASASRRFVISR